MGRMVSQGSYRRQISAHEKTFAVLRLQVCCWLAEEGDRGRPNIIELMQKGTVYWSTFHIGLFCLELALNDTCD